MTMKMSRSVLGLCCVVQGLLSVMVLVVKNVMRAVCPQRWCGHRQLPLKQQHQ